MSIQRKYQRACSQMKNAKKFTKIYQAVVKYVTGRTVTYPDGQ